MKHVNVRNESVSIAYTCWKFGERIILTQLKSFNDCYSLIVVFYDEIVGRNIYFIAFYDICQS